MVKNLPARFGKIPWRRAWQPTPVFLPGESHGQRRLAGCSPVGRKELDMTEAFSAGGCPMSEVRGRSREDPMPERRRPRAVTPRPRSRAVTKSARLRRRRNGREELLYIRG